MQSKSGQSLHWDRRRSWNDRRELRPSWVYNTLLRKNIGIIFLELIFQNKKLKVVKHWTRESGRRVIIWSKRNDNHGSRKIRPCSLARLKERSKRKMSKNISKVVISCGIVAFFDSRALIFYTVQLQIVCFNGNKAYSQGVMMVCASKRPPLAAGGIQHAKNNVQASNWVI